MNDDLCKGCTLYDGSEGYCRIKNEVPEYIPICPCTTCIVKPTCLSGCPEYRKVIKRVNPSTIYDG